MTVVPIAWREFASFFRLPLGWVVMALLTALAGVVVAGASLEPGAVASLRVFFVVCVHLLLPVVPAISMRLVSEEARTGTLETLLSSPVGSLELALGKFLGGWGFLVACLVPTLPMVGAVWMASEPRPDLGPVLAGYLAVVSLGAAYLAVGLAISAWTESQTLAYLGTFMLLLGVIVGTSLAPSYAPREIEGWLRGLSLTARLSDASKGVIDLSHLAYFWGFAAVGVGLSATIVEGRRR